VECFGDIKVQEVQSPPIDLYVKWVDAFPDTCGQWKQVGAFEDFTIEFTDLLPDIRVKFVHGFPDSGDSSNRDDAPNNEDTMDDDDEWAGKPYGPPDNDTKTETCGGTY